MSPRAQRIGTALAIALMSVPLNNTHITLAFLLGCAHYEIMWHTPRWFQGKNRP